MTDTAQNYNLLDEPWIPVLWADGTCARVGIKDALTQAHRIRHIAASNPMDRVAVLRFLLALLYWCRGSPPEDEEAVTGDAFPADWFFKLDDHRDCFHLLGQGKRFYQDKRARRRRPITDLLQEIPTGNNFWHFRHSTDGKDGLCLVCCALGLLRLPIFSVSGLPDLKSGINGAPPVYVLPCGASLRETLAANWRPHADLGQPAWIKPDITPTPGEAVPLLTGLTLLSRRVWLHDPVERGGACIACGATRSPLIFSCEYQSAGTQENELWEDPHVVYLDVSPRRPYRARDLTAPGNFTMDRPWADLLARIAETRKLPPSTRPLSLFVVGLATHQAKNIDVWERTVEAPFIQSHQTPVAGLLRRWDEQQRRDLPRHIRACTRSKLQTRAGLTSIRPHVEARVSARIGHLLTGGDPAWQEAATEYEPMMCAVAQSLAPGHTVSALERRRQIVRVAPNMHPETQPANAPRRKKGGNK